MYLTDLKFSIQKILLFLLFVLLLFRYLRNIWQKRDFFKKVRKLPGPFALPFIGTLYLFIRKPTDYMNVLEKLHYKYPKIYTIWVGSKATFFMSDPEYIQNILTNPLAMEKENFYDLITDVFGPGLLTSRAKIWKRHRKAIAPSFNQKILDSYVKIFADASAVFVNKMGEVGDHKDYDWSLLAKRYSLDVACKTIMGVDLNMDYAKHEGDDLGHCISLLSHYGTIRTMQVWYMVGFIYDLSPLKKKFDKYKDLFNNIITLAVKEKLHQLKENDNMHYAETEAKKRRPDLVEMIYENPMFTEGNLIYQVNTFLAAATDTTGMAICTTFIMLAMHPDIQQKVYDEVIDAIGFTGEIEPADLVKMKYLDRVIKESLRLFPSVVLFGRTLTGDINLGDVIVPKDTMCVIVPSLIHRDPKYWKDPLTFDPDRFLPEEKDKQHPCAYIPFSFGARNCIGGYYAYQNLKTITATVLRELKMYTSYKSVEEIHFTVQPVLTLTHGVKLWFEQRTQ